MSLALDPSARALGRVGQVLKEKWRLDSLLGVGGMAAVYAATHRNQKRVAVKVLLPELSNDTEVRTRFLREGYAANTIGHPGAVSVLDDDVTEDGSAFLVMELLEGETVEARWERKGNRLPLSEVLFIADQLLDVLASAHEKGIVHRDIKPENLFLARGIGLKVLDFGIARVFEGTRSKTETKAGLIMGTPAFMAPEQALAKWDEVDGRTDLWAVGAMIFTLLSGEHVHEAATGNEVGRGARGPRAGLRSHAPVARRAPDAGGRPRRARGATDEGGIGGADAVARGRGADERAGERAAEHAAAPGGATSPSVVDADAHGLVGREPGDERADDACGAVAHRLRRAIVRQPRVARGAHREANGGARRRGRRSGARAACGGRCDRARRGDAQARRAGAGADRAGAKADDRGRRALPPRDADAEGRRGRGA
jgi:serine/threonine-protein kinase